jgi:hypothetical protein
MQPLSARDGVVTYGMTRAAGAALLVLWAAILLAAAYLRRVTPYSEHWAQPLHWFESFYRVGSLIYGGGQVVLPMLIQETVQTDCSATPPGEVCPAACTPLHACTLLSAPSALRCMRAPGCMHAPRCTCAPSAPLCLPAPCHPGVLACVG